MALSLAAARNKARERQLNRHQHTRRKWRADVTSRVAICIFSCNRVYVTMKYFLLSIILSPCWSQVANWEMRPDVTFDDRNDRFDISELVAHQNMFLDSARVQEDFRRKESEDLNQLAANLRRKVRNNRDFSEFAYHDQMDSEDAGDVDEFNKILKGIQNTRRIRGLLDYIHNNSKGSEDNEKYVMDDEKNSRSQYVVPIDLKINGYIQAPLD
ncbi:unnamed protein product [Diatraea saccharalis]|uniref:Uncharacterized protein n=1 Tax=Diatraea saccharalis TaxID=40085 RepID=A0A9N9WIJ9_9NEOP|nr:unnamed protein product [Diatraea saccharalis]